MLPQFRAKGVPLPSAIGQHRLEAREARSDDKQVTDRDQEINMCVLITVHQA